MGRTLVVMRAREDASAVLIAAGDDRLTVVAVADRPPPWSHWIALTGMGTHADWCEELVEDAATALARTVAGLPRSVSVEHYVVRSWRDPALLRRIARGDATRLVLLCRPRGPRDRAMVRKAARAGGTPALPRPAQRAPGSLPVEALEPAGA